MGDDSMSGGWMLDKVDSELDREDREYRELDRNRVEVKLGWNQQRELDRGVVEGKRKWNQQWKTQ